ncbi:DUF1634 domain-containing protein [Paenibacillus sp. 1001270B_150601_E10]|uniref:DUF1634 domain-containing protein n=1 Tax=Paenibacillus sp. 1001270B_150601_E10 TaxID=2787079 RepID=UPI00189E9B2E|nr:DUF1634 domain-containing protein [Paenibacillus sp. 1001270B_150601_E10]
MKGIEDVELLVSKVIRVSVLISSGGIVCGLILFVITGQSGYPGDMYPTTLSTVVRGVLQLKPYGVMAAGLLLLILTPVIRVAVSILVFIKEKDWLYIAITAAVFVILIVSFILGEVS